MCGIQVNVFSDRLPHDDVIKWKHFPRYWPFVNSPVPAEFPTQRPVTRSFDIFFDLYPNKRLSKQWRGNRAHYDVTVKYHVVNIQIIIPHPWGSRLIRTRGSFSCLIIAWKVFEISLITMYCARIENNDKIRPYWTLTWKTSISSRMYNGKQGHESSRATSKSTPPVWSESSKI